MDRFDIHDLSAEEMAWELDDGIDYNELALDEALLYE